MCNLPFSSYSKFSNFFSQIREDIGSLTLRPPKAGPTTLVTSNSFKANWKSVCGATSYRLDVATDNSFTNYVTGYHNLFVADVTGRTVIGLNPEYTYFYRVRAIDDYGPSGNSDPPKQVTTLGNNTYDGRYEGFLSGQNCCCADPPCVPCPYPGAALSFEVSGSIVHLDSNEGSIDSNGHFDLTLWLSTWRPTFQWLDCAERSCNRNMDRRRAVFCSLFLKFYLVRRPPAVGRTESKKGSE